MRFGVVVFPGSNCDRDAYKALHDVMGFPVEMLWHKDPDLRGVEAIVLPGGFSYGDYLRSGALAKFSPVMDSVRSLVDQGGFVLGICNGFQVLCESGLLPGALRRNVGGRFICKNVYLAPEVKPESPTTSLRGQNVLKIPIAHSEGAYYADKETLSSLRHHEQILFRYCEPNGEVRESANPNGTIDNIAGICSRNKRVIGMMPHPERASSVLQGNTDGLKILRSICAFWDSLK